MNLIRDIASPSAQDPYFPPTRHKDWYLGHSWAQGLDCTPGPAKSSHLTSIQLTQLISFRVMSTDE